MIIVKMMYLVGFPGGSVVKNPPVNAGDMGLIPGSEKIPWRRKWQPTPVFLPGKSHEEPGGLQSMGLQRAGYNCCGLGMHTSSLRTLVILFNHLRNCHQTVS